MKVKLTKEQVNLLLQGSVLEKNGVVYCHLPYWYKGTIGGDEFDVYFPDRLPEELLEGLKAERDENCLYNDKYFLELRGFQVDENCFKDPLTPDKCYEKL